MDLGIDGRTALVTGASRGIGRACARALADAGCDVAINARGEETLGRTAKELSGDGARVEPIPGDVSDADDVASIVRETRRTLDPPEILIANAGGPPPGGFDEVDDEDWQAGFDLTVMSAVRLTRAVLDGMRDTGWGRIVYVTSSSVVEPIPNLVLSNSLRRAVVGTAKTLSKEVAGDGITVNCLAPGSTATDRIYDLARDRARRAGTDEEAMVERMQDDIPVGRFAEPGEIGAACAFLCSDRAAYVNGQLLAVDGGRLGAV